MSRPASDPGSAGPQPPTGGPSPTSTGPPTAPSPRDYVRILVIAALLAALASLGLGLVFGPEAPLTALGLSAGLVAARALGPGASGGQILVIAGTFAAISTVFGGPLPSALLPGFLASGTAALVFTGVDHWPGVAETVLRLPALPDYPTVRLVDVAWCVLVALVAAVVAAGARGIAREMAERAAKLPVVALLCAAGLVVGLLAVGFRAVTGQPVDLVLFSGESALPQVIAETSAGVLALLVVVKGAAYALSLGAGFRGGPTFPAVTLGVAVGVLGSILLPGLDLTPAVIAELAAGASAALGLSFFGALLAVLMASSAAAETIPIAVIASVIGWLVATTLQQRETRHQPSRAPAS
jgi:H+/Cl- antiporter ClcA